MLERIEAGDRVVITVRDRNVALLSPLPAPPTWMDARSFFSELEGIRADSGLRRELNDLLNP